jgi:hypothetical protein
MSNAQVCGGAGKCSFDLLRWKSRVAKAEFAQFHYDSFLPRLSIFSRFALDVDVVASGGLKVN